MNCKKHTTAEMEKKGSTSNGDKMLLDYWCKECKEHYYIEENT